MERAHLLYRWTFTRLEAARLILKLKQSDPLPDRLEESPTDYLGGGTPFVYICESDGFIISSRSSDYLRLERGELYQYFPPVAED